MKVVWGVFATCFGANSRPRMYEHFWSGISQVLPGGQDFYMFGLAVVCWATWKARNNACFGKILIKHPCDILFSACAFMRYWAGICFEDRKSIIMAGAETMFKTAVKVVRRRTGNSTTLRITEDGEEEDQEGGDQEGVAREEM